MGRSFCFTTSDGRVMHDMNTCQCDPVVLTYDFPLRPDFNVRLHLPADITPNECERLCAFLDTLAITGKTE